jgi:hypothetical protein
VLAGADVDAANAPDANEQAASTEISAAAVRWFLMRLLPFGKSVPSRSRGL